MRKLFALLVPLFVMSASLSAQEPGPASGETCGGPVYKSSEVSRRVAFGVRPVPSMTDQARENWVHGKIVLSAVLCKSGLVTDIKVLKGLPFGMTESAIEAARR